MFYTISSVAPICTELHASGKILVLATGFFDLLHEEHVNFLQKAKAAGDILMVAVESDERARKLKGERRPIEPQSVRCLKVSQIPSGSDLEGSAQPADTKAGRSDPQGKLVDFVIALPPDFDHFEAYDSLLSAIRPQVYAISSHTDHQKSKTFLVEKYGGKLVVVHEHNPEISTTKILENTKI